MSRAIAKYDADGTYLGWVCKLSEQDSDDMALAVAMRYRDAHLAKAWPGSPDYRVVEYNDDGRIVSISQPC